MKNIFLLVLVILSFYGITFAQEISAPVDVTTTAPAPEVKQRFSIGAGYWYTNASMDSFVYDADLGGKISELNNDLDAGLFVINAEAYLFWRLYADVFIGWGDFEGDHRDSDWILPGEVFIDSITWGDVADILGLDLSQPYSVTVSDADGDVTIWNINGYVRVIEQPENKGYLDVSLGYFYYQDDIEHLHNSTWVTYFWETINDTEALAGHDSQSKFTFDGIRLGVRGKVRLHDRIAIKASGGIVPWADVEEDAYWNLREMDIKGEADGTIFDLDIGLEFKVTKNLFIEAGYKYINLDSDRGDDTRTWADGSTITLEDGFAAEGERGGFYAMGRLKI